MLLRETAKRYLERSYILNTYVHIYIREREGESEGKEGGKRGRKEGGREGRKERNDGGRIFAFK